MSERISVALKGVSKRFGELAAVNAVDLQVARGEFFSLLGPSGCGKTTTLRMIGGLTTPDQGDVLINSVRVNDFPPYKRDASIVFQNLALFPHLTVAGNIAYGLKLRRLPREHIDRKVAEMLELVQLSGLDKRRPDQLSGGQQQRVAVARSLVLQPEVLLLDEPLAALDRKLRKEMQIELRRIQRDVGTTFIYVTHDQKEALSMSDRIAVMKDGKVAQLGTPRQIYERPASKFVADFMGAANVFDVRVTQQDDSLVTLQTERGTEILATVAQLQPDLTTVGCSIRPEAIRLSATSDGAIGHNRHQGTIVSMVYLGDVIEVTVGLATSDHMVAFLPTTARQMALEEGQTVEVSWSASDSNLLVA